MSDLTESCRSHACRARLSVALLSICARKERDCLRARQERNCLSRALILSTCFVLMHINTNVVYLVDLFCVDVLPQHKTRTQNKNINVVYLVDLFCVCGNTKQEQKCRLSTQNKNRNVVYLVDLFCVCGNTQQVVLWLINTTQVTTKRLAVCYHNTTCCVSKQARATRAQLSARTRAQLSARATRSQLSCRPCLSRALVLSTRQARAILERGCLRARADSLALVARAPDASCLRATCGAAWGKRCNTLNIR